MNEWGTEKTQTELEGLKRVSSSQHRRLGAVEVLQSSHTSEIDVLKNARTDMEGDIDSIKTELGERFQSLSRNIWQATSILVTVAIAVLGILKIGG